MNHEDTEKKHFKNSVTQWLRGKASMFLTRIYCTINLEKYKMSHYERKTI